LLHSRSMTGYVAPVKGCDEIPGTTQNGSLYS